QNNFGAEGNQNYNYQNNFGAEGNQNFNYQNNDQSVSYNNTQYASGYDANGYNMNAQGARLNGQAMSVDKMAAEMEKEENVGKGILGAILGSLVGVAFMVLLSMGDRVSFYTGFIMAICAFKGYEKFSGRNSYKGIAISTIVTLIMVYVGTRLCFAIDIMQLFKGYSVFEAFIEVDDKIDKFGETWRSAFMENLVMQYIFSGVGLVVAVISGISGKKEKESGLGSFKRNDQNNK
nr:hypothetical protein [Butyrivibrio sp.]